MLSITRINALVFISGTIANPDAIVIIGLVKREITETLDLICLTTLHALQVLIMIAIFSNMNNFRTYRK